MAKGKSLNPADAYRKAQRKKELKKNKTERAKARDFALVKKDTGDLEDEIEKLEASSELSASDRSQLMNMKNDLSRIMKKKDEYVKEHPEQRKLVYRPRKQNKGGHQKEVVTANELRSDEDNEDSDEDIVMPEGPPPNASLGDSEGCSDDDIPMPDGPPPGNVPDSDIQPLLGLGLPSPLSLPHVPLSAPSLILPPPPPLTSAIGGVYTAPPGFAFPPLPPPGFFPRRIQPTTTIQDPLSSVPHQTYQAYRASQLPPGHPSLPPKPVFGTSGATTAHAGAIISAEPELRDLKKEATAFIPTSLKRKRVPGLPSSSKVNAAPFVGAGLEAASLQARSDLVSMLKTQLGTVTVSLSNKEEPDKGAKAPIVKERDDYQKFVDEVSDLLGPPGSS